MDLEVLGSSPRGGTIPAPALSGFDRSPIGDKASGGAAGMLAAASEALETAGSSFERLRRARDHWPALAASLQIELDRSGAVHVSARNADVDAAVGLQGLGARAERVELPNWTASALGGCGVWTAEDWRLEPASALTALQRAFLAAGGRWIASEISSASEVLALGANSQVVVAMGWRASACVALAPPPFDSLPTRGREQRLNIAREFAHG